MLAGSITKDLILFPFFASIQLWCPQSNMPSPANPVLAPIVGKFDTSMVLTGNLLECEEKCSFSEWASFIHFAVTENGQLCFGNTSSCDCASLLCIGDTIRVFGPTGRYGTLQIPYSTPKPNALLSHQYDWLEFCRDDFLEQGLNVVCRQLHFEPHKTYASFEMRQLGLPPLTPNASFMTLPYFTDCLGSEEKLSQCQFDKKTPPSGCRSRPVDVYCSKASKGRIDEKSITGSTQEEDFELLVYMNHIAQWSTVCRKNWTAEDNTLACQMAGLTDPFDRAQARSCWEHRMNYDLWDWTPSSGWYYIYSTKLDRVIRVYCNMDFDTGGWTLVLAADFPDVTSGWTNESLLNRSFDDPHPSRDYSILSLADSFQLWCPQSNMPSPANPVLAPIVGKFDTSMVLTGNLLECEEKCSFSEWASFIHFAVTENGQLCFGNTSSCDCASLLCIGDTIRVFGPTGRYGTLQIPYSTPKPNALLSHQYDWLEFCRDDFLEQGLNVVCRQLHFEPHKTYASFEMRQLGLPPLTPNASFMTLPYFTDCLGSEEKLSQCQFDKKTPPSGCRSRPVDVYCSKASKGRIDEKSITGSTQEEDFELLVYMNHIAQWSTVCRKNWTAEDNTLACQMAGLTDPFDRAQARSCWEHRMNYDLWDWTPSSGWYYIYSTKLDRVIRVYCNMDFDTGGWTLVLAADFPDVTSGWTNESLLNRSFDDPHPSRDYSILSLADSFQITEAGNNAEFLVVVSDPKNDTNTTIHVQYPSSYSLTETTQKFEGVTLLSYSVAFDKTKGFGAWEGNTSTPYSHSVTIGMPWIYRDIATGNLMYTMNDMQSLNITEDVTDAPEADPSDTPTSSTTSTVSSTDLSSNSADPSSSGSTAVTESVGSDAGDEGAEVVEAAKNETKKAIVFPGTIIASQQDRRVFDVNHTRARIAFYVRAPNYEIKEAPLIDCKHMDYLFDGNQRIEKGQFFSSSVQAMDYLKFLDAHNSFLSETTSVVYGGGGWVTNNRSVLQTSWISVDLLAPHKITAVLTRGVEVFHQGKIYTSNIEKFTMQVTHERHVFMDSSSISPTSVDGGSVFDGNHEGNLIKTNTFEMPEEHVRFARLNPRQGIHLNYEDHSPRKSNASDDQPGYSYGMRWELIGCNQKPLDKFTYVISNLSRLAVGLSLDDTLDYRMGTNVSDIWHKEICANQEFQIRFPEMYLIKQIIIAGHPNNVPPTNVVINKFQIMFSKSGSEDHLRWYGINMDSPSPPEEDEPREFSGPENGASPSFISFKYPWSARLVRLVITDSPNNCYVRFEFVGRPLRDSCMLPLGMSKADIKDYQLTASSQYQEPCHNPETHSCMTSYGPERARYNGTNDTRGFGGWKPHPNDRNASITVDLRRKVEVTAMIVESFDLSYMEKFELRYSQNAYNWSEYTIHTENMVEQIGIYNIYYFSPPIYTRHLRIFPKKYSTFGLYDEPVVKFELLGCNFHPEYHTEAAEFSRFRDSLLFPNPHFDSYWYNHTDIDCANRCLHERGFVCRGYYMMYANRTCVLSSASQESWDVTGFQENIHGTDFYQRDVDCSRDVGLTNIKVFKDAWFDASSSAVDSSPESARLMGKEDGLYYKGWRPSINDSEPYLQVFLNTSQTGYRIRGVHMNGNGSKNFVTHFKIANSTDGVNFTFCCNKDIHTMTHINNATVLDGNTQALNPETIWLPRAIRGTYIRIYPNKTSINKPAALQIELMGCPVWEHRAKYPMAFSTMKCTGLEEKMEDCPTKVSDPRDKHCNLQTAVRPKCKAHCGDPGIRACATRTGIHFYSPNNVTFQCLDGTNQTTTCESDGYWSSLGKSCVMDKLINVAIQKTAIQSSTSKSPSMMPASNAVDGDPGHTIGDLRTCSFTLLELNPWWYLDLGRVYEISSIIIHPGFAFHNAEVRVGPHNPAQSDNSVNLTVNNICWLISGQSSIQKRSIPIRCRHMPIFGRFLSIQMPSTVPIGMSLCEVQVFGKPCMEGDLEDQADFSSKFLSQPNASKAIGHAATDESRKRQLQERCKSTDGRQDYPYWVIMPGGQLYVEGVTLDTANVKEDQLTDFEIRVGEYSRKEDIANNTLCYESKGAVALGKKAWRINCTRGLYGSYVTIQRKKMNSKLVICDIKVWGRVCMTVMEATHMHPVRASSYETGQDIWVLLAEDQSCFHTKKEVSPWVVLDMAAVTEMYKAKFKLCNNMTSGRLTVRVGDSMDPTKNGILKDDIQITGELSREGYFVEKKDWPYIAGRYISIHLNALPGSKPKLQSLCICNLTINRDRYCPREHYHNVAYGIYPNNETSLPHVGLSLTTDGERRTLRHLCWTSEERTKPFWIITLPKARSIFTVRVIGRQNTNREVRVGTQSTDWRQNALCGFGPLESFSTAVKEYTRSCVTEKGEPLTGTVISIEVVDPLPQNLTLCEVEAWGV